MSAKKAKKAQSSSGEPKAAKAGKTGRRTDDRSAAASTPGLSVAGHPRAERSVREIKAWAGLAGFTAALLLSLQAHVPLAMAGERALIGGVGAYLIAWGCAVAVWRALLLAELRAHADALTARREEAAAAAASPKPVSR